MQVILIDKVVNLGTFGEKVNVKAGYARNFLIPKGKAVPATKKNIEYFETRSSELEMQYSDFHTELKLRAKKIEELKNVIISANVGKEGKLFGSIGSRDIEKAIISSGIKIERHEIRIPNGTIRTIGTHEIKIKIHSNICINFNVIIISK